MKDATIFWDGIAEKYAKSPIGDEKAYLDTLNRTRGYLSKEDTVLEVGCGTGSTALLLADSVKQIVGSDLSKNMIKIAIGKTEEQGVENVTFVTADLIGDPMPGDIYDAVLAHNILHLVEDTAGAVARIHDFLKPGGVFISKTVLTPGSTAPFLFRLLIHAVPLMQFFGKAPFVKFMKGEILEKIITSAGFEIVESGHYPKNAVSRYIVARKK